MQEAQKQLSCHLLGICLTFTTSQLKFPGRSWGASYQNFNKPKDAKNQEKKAESLAETRSYGEWWGTTQILERPPT